MDNTEDFLKNYRGKYSQYWIERWGLIPELPTSFDNANSTYELVAWLQRAFKNLLDDFQQLESEHEDFKNALIDLLEYLIPELIRRHHDSAEFRTAFIILLEDILAGEERTWVKDLLKELIEVDMREWIEDYLKGLNYNIIKTDLKDRGYNLRYNESLVTNGDWSIALQTAIDTVDDGSFVEIPFDITISTTIKVRRGVGLKGVGNVTITADYANWVDHTFGADIPLKTALWFEPRQPIFESERKEQSITISDFVIKALNDTNNLSVGIYLGMSDISTITGTTVNNSVTGKNFSNITLQDFNNQLVLAEVWDCSFTNLILTGSKNYGIYIHGQSVNNVFTACRSYGGVNAIRVEGKDYSGTNKRPEGITFNGGFAGSAKIGINHVNGLYIVYSNIVVDLNSVNAFRGVSVDCSVLSGCYLFSQGRTMELATVPTNNNNSFNVIGNQFIGTATSDCAIGNADNWSGVNIIGNTFISYKMTACILVGIDTQMLISGNSFKNNTVNQCILASSLSKPTLGVNTTTDNNVILINQGTDYMMHSLASDLGIGNFKVKGDTGNMRFTSNGLDITLDSGLNVNVNGRQMVLAGGITITDIDNIKGTMLFNVKGIEGLGAGIYYGKHIEYDKNTGMQEVTKHGSTIISRRFKSNGVWGAWA